MEGSEMIQTKNLDGQQITLESSAMAALERAMERCPERIVVTSSYRSFETQRKLYEAYMECVRRYGHVYRCGLVASPGTSKHNFGEAIDIANWSRRKVRRALKSEGWFWGHSFGDDPHFSYGSLG